MLRRGFVILFVAVGFGLPANLLSYNDDSTHYELTQEVVDFYSVISGRGLNSDEKEVIASGAAAEDTPPRWVNHFYDPVHNEPWLARYFGTAKAETAYATAKSAFGIDRTYTIKDWSQNESAQNKYQAYKGNRTFQRALYEYTQGDKKEALYTLGFILHLIEDMTVPDHTRGDTHWENGITDDPGSPYEQWAETLTRSTNLTIAQNLVRQKAKPVQVDSLNQVFDSIASYSNNNFFSEDTISDTRFDNPQPNRVIEINEKESYVYKDEALLVKAGNFDGKTKYTVDDDKILQGYWSQLSPLAVRAGAGVMDYFFREVERIEKEKIVLENPNSLSKRLAGGFMLSPYGEVNRVEKAVGTVKQVAIALGGAAKQTVSSIFQKVKLATTEPSNPHPTLSLDMSAEALAKAEGRGNNNSSTPPQRGGELVGQVLGEQVEASNVVAPTTPTPPQRGGESLAISTPEQAVKKEEKKTAATVVAKENIKSNNPSSSKEIATRPAAARNDRKEGRLRDDSKETGESADLAGKNDNIASSNPHPTLSLEGRGDIKSASPTSPSPSLARRGGVSASFIGIHAPAPQTTPSTTSASSADEPTSPPPAPPPDTIPPITWITILPATSTAASFIVQWNGTDNIQMTPTSYDIQYQGVDSIGLPLGGLQNDSWFDWALATSSTSSIFIGQDEKTYGFRSRGRDQEGNQSVYPSTAETYTYLNLSVPNAPTVTSHTNNQTITNNDDIATSTAGVQITLSGTANPNDIVSIALSETLANSTTTASSTGAWTTLLTLAEGVNTITLQSQEADGDASATTTIAFNLIITPLREVVINEIAWMGTAASFSDEWLELYNPGETTVDLTGWTLRSASGTPSIILSGSIAAKGYFLLERTDDSTVNNIAADQIYTGALSNSGELLTLRKSDNTLVDKIGSSTVAWFAGSNTSKATMERKNPTADGEDPSNWANNDTLFINGQDADSANLKATPKSLNSVNTIIPRPTTDLTIQNIYTTHNIVKLYWTAPLNANLNTTGQTAYYDVRYTSGAGCTVTDSSYETAAIVNDEPLPSVTVGTAQSLVITNLNASTPYCFALKTYNGANMSGISNIASSTTHALPSQNPLTRIGFINNIFPNNYIIALAGSPYLVDGTFYVNAGNTVTIEPGVVIKMTSGTQWQISGQLTINGTALNPVVITSVKDDTFAGDSNNDGNATWPNGGDWYRFQVSNTAARLTLTSTIMRYGGRFGSPMIALTGGAAAVITDSILERSSQNAIAMANDGTGLTLANSTLRNNDLEGVGISSRANAAIRGSTFTNNRRGIAIGTDADVANLIITGNNFYANNANPGSAPNAGIHFSDVVNTLTAANNWWGSVDGPTTVSPDSDAARDAALGNINFIPWAASVFPALPGGF